MPSRRQHPADHDLLSAKYDLRKVRQRHEEELISEIDSYPENKPLNTSPQDLAEYFAEKYRIEPLKILEDEVVVDPQDQKVDVSHDRMRAIRDRSTPTYIDGTVTEVVLPFRGDSDLLRCVASRRSMSPPRGTVRGENLHYTITRTDHGAERVRKDIEKWIRDVKEQASWIADDLNPWNEKLQAKARNRIEQRREKLLKDREFGEALGFPLKEREGQPTSYAAPDIERKKPPSPPPASSEPYQPEPTLTQQDYEHVLEVIQQTATMLERSPSTFQGMDEEQLRNQFLVPLNSHYEGQSTGETFNRGGKTDILVRVDDRTVFIAECKIWRGPKSLNDAIDQILGYTSWRDTKTAVMLFNRDRQISTILDKVPQVLEEHPHLKGSVDRLGEGKFQGVLGSRNDPNRELTLTVLVFDIPNIE